VEGRFGADRLIRQCKVEGCERPYLALGHCRLHYQRQREGRPMDGVKPVEPARDCSISECPRPVTKRGKCEYHYRRGIRETKGLRVRESLHPSTFRDRSGNKYCPLCGGWLPESDFYSHPSQCDGLSRACRPCESVRGRRKHLLKKYGLTQEAFDALLGAQEGRCAICERQLSERICVDHDHSCCPGATTCGNCVRSLLCVSCNTALGHFSDSPEILLRAHDYLVRHHRGAQ
jgi:hypothetical protein